MQKIKFLSLILVTIISLNSIAQKGISLQKGKKYQVESSTTTNGVAEVLGQSMESLSESKSTVVYEVVSGSASSSALTKNITQMKVHVNIMGQDMNFDSEKKDNSGQLADQLSPTLNKPSPLTIDSKGNITSEGSADGDALTSLPGASSGIETSIDLFVPALIGKTLAVGNSFTDTFSIKKDKYNSSDSGTYNVTSIENGIASISYTGTQTISSVTDEMGMEVTNNSKNNVKKELKIDIKTGLVLSKQIEVDAKASIEVSGMSLPTTTKTVTTVKITALN